MVFTKSPRESLIYKWARFLVRKNIIGQRNCHRGHRPIIENGHWIYLMVKKGMCVSWLNATYKHFISAWSGNQKRENLNTSLYDFGDRVRNRSAHQSLRIQSVTAMRAFMVTLVIKMFHLNTCESLMQRVKYQWLLAVMIFKWGSFTKLDF